MVRKWGNNHVYIKLVEFLIETTPPKYNLSKILQKSVLFNSEIPFVEIYLKIIMIEEPNDCYAKIFIGALLEKQKRWKRPKNPTTERWLKK